MAAINITSSKYLISFVSMPFILSFRFLFASIILFVLLLFGKNFKQQFMSLKCITKKQWVMLILQSLCAGIIFNIFLLFGIRYTNPSIAGIITSAIPAMIICLAYFILKEKPSRTKIFCVAFATLGLLIINVTTLHINQNVLLTSLGIALLMLSLIPESLYYVLSKAYSLALSTLMIAFLINLINLVASIPFLISISLKDIGNLPILFWYIISISGAASGLFYVFWLKGVTHIDSSTSGLLTTTMPIFTLLLSFLFFGSWISLGQSIGMFLILISIIFSNQKVKLLRYKRARGA